MDHTATYSPEDNKLRLYPAFRLDSADYQRMKDAGFKWAPKQELFVAPMWTPAREDVLLDLCGEIGDEDKSLVDRAEERADRFEDYSDARMAEATAAHKAVSDITAHIPFGQPILVGHHSERRARKDAERIENGMRRAVRLWDTSEYWTRRAAGAVAAAKYKERPDVRARRIKTIEADKRKQERELAEAEKWLAAWSTEGLTLEQAVRISDFCWLYLPRKEGDLPDFDGRPTAHSVLTNAHPSLYAPRSVEEVVEHAKAAYPRAIAHAKRWIAHYDNRLAYERAMLEDAGGTVADQTKPEKGGACRCWCSPHHSGGWSYVVKVNKVSVTVLHSWGNGGAPHRVTVKFEDLTAIMTQAQVEDARQAGRVTDTEDGRGFYLADAPTPSPEPTDETKADAAPAVEVATAQGDLFASTAAEVAETAAPVVKSEAFDKMRDQLRQGVQVVSAPQLFPTPAALASRMVDLAAIRPGERVLEPSAGTGRLLGAMGGRMFGHNPERGEVVAVEVNRSLASRLRDEFPKTRVHCADFLSIDGPAAYVGHVPESVPLGQFDAILMNPPFVNAEDIKHILHAHRMLKPGGRLVAICADGPRQRETLRPMAEASGGSWEALPAGTFQEAGTAVATALLVMHA